MPIVVLTAVSFILVNLGVLFADIATGGRNPLSDLWLIGPAFLWMIGLATFLRSRPKTYWLLCLCWLYLLLAHAGIVAVQRGPLFGAASFLAWGAWFGGFLWIVFGRDRWDWALFVLYLFAFAGILHALPVIYEFVFDTVLRRVVTMEGLTRRYGYTSSGSVLGIQLGAGIFATLYFGMKARRLGKRLMMHLLAGIQWAALVLSATRGPLIFALVVLFFIAFRVRRVRSHFILRHAVLVLVVGGLAVVGLLISGGIGGEYVRFGLAALSIGDFGNQVRIERWLATWHDITQTVPHFLLGYGSGTTVVIANLLGEPGVTPESSVLVLWYEMGLIGIMLFGSLLATPLIRVFRSFRSSTNCRGAPERMPATLAPLLGVLCLVLLEMAIHGMIMTWIIAFYFWFTLGALHKLSWYNRHIPT